MFKVAFVLVGLGIIGALTIGAFMYNPALGILFLLFVASNLC
jgi:hypothetical protein